jgi:hypothetical protein
MTFEDFLTRLPVPPPHVLSKMGEAASSCRAKTADGRGEIAPEFPNDLLLAAALYLFWLQFPRHVLWTPTPTPTSTP